jgi:hypothetical protein
MEKICNRYVNFLNKKRIFKIMLHENLNQDNPNYIKNIFITKKLIGLFAYIEFEPFGK